MEPDGFFYKPHNEYSYAFDFCNPYGNAHRRMLYVLAPKMASGLFFGGCNCKPSKF